MLVTIVLAAGVLVTTDVDPRAVAAATLNGHSVVLDSSGRIVPWTTDVSAGYGTVIDNAWNYLVNAVPNDPGTGKPAFYSQSYLDPDTQQVAGWPNNPAGMTSMLTESALKYYAYSGNLAPVTLVQNLATWILGHGMTTSTANWAGVPYASGDDGSLTYSGASVGNQTGVGDGSGYLEPDKVGQLGVAWFQLYQFSGNSAYLNAAIAAANALAVHVRTGTATQSPWPFRVNALTGAVREDYTADVIEPIELLDDLVTAGLGNTSAYQAARQTAWTWMMTYPMRNNVWSQYFEDVEISTDNTNYNQYVPMMTARYLLLHPQYDSNWQADVRGLVSWVESTFAVTYDGANTISEQEAFLHPMGSHTSRYASVNALLYEFTGDTSAQTKAYYSLNWATYMARPNGVDIDGPDVGNEWFTDGYGDYIRHFLTAMQAVPQWAPNGQTHLTGSTSIITNISYGTNGITYATADSSATDSFRLNYTPVSVSVNGVALAKVSSLTQPGWTYDPSTGVMRVLHTSGKSIVVTGMATAPGLVVSPASSSISGGTSSSFQVTRQGVDVTSTSVLSISPNGTCTAASCTAAITGTHTVTATNGSSTGVATLTVTTAVSGGGVSPPVSDVVGVGDPFSQYGMDFLADGDARGDAGVNGGATGQRMRSINATDDADGRTDYQNASTTAKAILANSTVVLAPGTSPVRRPTSSAEAVNALLADTSSTALIQFARSVQLPTAGQQASAGAHGWGGLHSYQYASDALKIAARSAGTNAPAGLSQAEVLNIYKGTWTTWGQIPGYTGSAPGNRIIALLPRSGTDVRGLFDAALAAANGGAPITYGSNVVLTGGNDYTAIASSTSPSDAIYPFPAGQMSLLTSGYFADLTTSPIQMLSGAGPDQSAAFTSVVPLYVIVRDRDVATSTKFRGSTKSWFTTLFAGNSYLASALGQSLLSSAGLVPGYVDLGDVSRG
jgi:hypothetical protein